MPDNAFPMNTAPLNALPRGFRFAATNCGLRKAPNLDLGLMIADEEAAAAGVFTQNLVQAAPVVLCRRHLRKAGSRMRAVIVNSRNANCATGEAGMDAAEATAPAVAREIGCDAEPVFVCSTGGIGISLTAGRILNVVLALSTAADGSPDGFCGC